MTTKGQSNTNLVDDTRGCSSESSNRTTIEVATGRPASSAPTSPRPPSAKDTTNHANQQQQHQQQREQPSLSAWPETPRQFLDRLKETVSKAELGNVLSKGSDPFHQAVLRTHMESFDFRRDPIDMALRKFLLDFHFPKEAQQIDRVLEAFAYWYHACNPHLFRSAEVVYTIAFSLMLLHTDAHNKNVRYKMTKEQYVKQAKTIDGVNTIPADILEVLYDNITFLKFVYAEDELDVDGQRLADVQQPATGWFQRRRTASNQRSDSYSMIRHGSISYLAPDISDLIPFRWPYYWKGTIEMVDNVQINNQFTKAPSARIPGLQSRRTSQHFGQLISLQNGATMDHHSTEETGNKDHQPNIEMTSTAMASMDGAAELKIAKCGILTRKIDIEHGKKSSVRGWRDLGVVLSGSQLLFFTELAWFHQQKANQRGFNPKSPPEADGYFSSELQQSNNSSSGGGGSGGSGGSSPPMPQALISTLDSIAVVDSSYQKYPHVFRLVCPHGKQYLFRASSEHDMNDWMSKINYASAFKTAGVRLRNYRVAWASDVYWIKDEQGRHQLKRRGVPRQSNNHANNPSSATLTTTTLTTSPDGTTTASTATTPTTSHSAASPLYQQQNGGRADLIMAKMKDIDKLINTCAASLAAELRLARGLEVMIPLQTATRQKIVQSATVVGKRLRHLMLERTKLDCFRTILERDLAVVMAAPPSQAPCTPDGYYHTLYNSNHHHHHYQSSSNQSFSDRSSTLRSYPSRDQIGANGSLGGDFFRMGSSNGVVAMDDRVDPAKDDYVLDSSTARSSQSSNRSIKGATSSSSSRPRLNIPEFSRAASETALSDQQRLRSARGLEIPQGPMAVQAAIIGAARGNHLVPPLMPSSSSTSSTRSRSKLSSSPDPNQSQQQQRSHNQQQKQSGTPMASMTTNQSTMCSQQEEEQQQQQVSTTAAAGEALSTGTTRARALSMPGQRPVNMPRTVSIYSSSSQTANRLKRIFEQGLGHFRWKSSSSSSSSSSNRSEVVSGGGPVPPTPPLPSKLTGFGSPLSMSSLVPSSFTGTGMEMEESAVDVLDVEVAAAQEQTSQPELAIATKMILVNKTEGEVEVIGLGLMDEDNRSTTSRNTVQSEKNSNVDDGDDELVMESGAGGGEEDEDDQGVVQK
ncbi:hypothetical protein BG004_004607 [Podila humilis]|nr:hypothetical protein BG004_004607 [Podila humilis]